MQEDQPTLRQCSPWLAVLCKVRMDQLSQAIQVSADGDRRRSAARLWLQACSVRDASSLVGACQREPTSLRECRMRGSEAGAVRARNRVLCASGRPPCRSRSRSCSRRLRTRQPARRWRAPSTPCSPSRGPARRTRRRATRQARPTRRPGPGAASRAPAPARAGTPTQRPAQSPNRLPGRGRLRARLRRLPRPHPRPLRSRLRRLRRCVPRSMAWPGVPGPS
jgi:hypothetical protein